MSNVNEIACGTCVCDIFRSFWIFPRNRLAVLKARQANHTLKTQKLGFTHAPPSGKVLPARRHILDFPILAGFGWFCVVGGLVNLYDVCMIELLCDYL